MKIVLAGFCKAVIISMVVVALNGCKPQSEFKKGAEKATSIASDSLAAIKGGTISFGDYDKLSSRIKQAGESVSGLSKSTDAGEAASQEVFVSAWMLFESKFHSMGTSKFLNEKLRTAGDGGISPTFTASIGIDDIRDIEASVDAINEASKKLK